MTTVAAQQVVSRPKVGVRRIPVLLKQAFFLLFVGAVISILMVWALGMWGEPASGTALTAAGAERGKSWELYTWNSIGSMRLYSKRQAQLWSGYQVTGPQDSPMGGDSSRAWCPATEDGQMEWLVLDYPQAVYPRQVEIYENYFPGAASRITIFNERGEEVELWSGQDPTAPGAGSGISKIPVSTTTPISRIKIYFDSQKTPGWNEVDAVGLTDRDGKTWWASDVEDSSSYGNTMLVSNGGPGPMELMPDWCPAKHAKTAAMKGGVEERVFEARGWPMLAMWSERKAGVSASNSSQKYLGGYVAPGLGTMALNPLLPTRPIWMGLGVDTIFYAVVLGGLYWGLMKPRMLVRELRWMRKGCCVECGYDLDFDFKGGCPECGWRRTRG
jgi:hypothetical protein